MKFGGSRQLTVAIECLHELKVHSNIRHLPPPSIPPPPPPQISLPPRSNPHGIDTDTPTTYNRAFKRS
jgi:hypothetical protein